jgi:membrane dipeptidase
MTDPAVVHQSAIVIDTHADTPQRFVDEHWNFTDPLNGGMLNYASARKGNLDAQFFSIWVDPNQYPANASARRTLELIDATLEQVRKAPDKSKAAIPSKTRSAFFATTIVLASAI